MTLKRTERGWAGHLCVASMCRFRRNTLLEYGNKRIVVSTVGNYRNPIDGKPETIGLNRYYETMAFEAKKDGVYWEANIGVEIPFKSPWAIDHLEQETDLEADKMHEKVVRELSKKLVDKQV